MKQNGAVVFALFSLAAVVAADDRPNIVLIFVDDLGYGDLSCYGNTKFQTPNLDRMSKEGVRLTEFYVTTPFCAPSRGALLTGRYPFRNGVITNPAPDGRKPLDDKVGLRSSEITIAEILKSAGYETACVGKWHLGHYPEFYPQTQGFNDHFGILYSNDMRPVQLMHNSERVEYPVLQATLTQRYTDRAIEFIEKNRSRPFFLYLPHAMPHKPLAASEAFYKKSGAGLYGDVVTELDANIGRLLERIDGLGLDSKTLVIFTSDNGATYGGSTGGLRGMKGSTFDGGIKVPCIARWKGKIPASQIDRDPVISVDWLPTILAAVGATAPADRKLDGTNILPSITSDSRIEPRNVFFENGGQLHAVRNGKWKLHFLPPRDRLVGQNTIATYVDPRAPDGVTILAPPEQAKPDQHPGLTTGDIVTGIALFDLEKDRGEQKDVAAKNPAVVHQLLGACLTLREEMEKVARTEAKSTAN